MATSLRILQVNCGDAILVKYQVGKEHRNVIIDSGYSKTYPTVLKPELIEIIKKGETIDPWILTHLDADHINGLVSCLRDSKINSKLTLKTLWFNCFGRFRIPNVNGLVSVGKGIEIRDITAQLGIKLVSNITCGAVFDDGLAKIVVLSPDRQTLQELSAHWAVQEARYYKTDSALQISAKTKNDYHLTIEQLAVRRDAKEKRGDITNRSSIAFMLAINGKSILFLGDSYPSSVLSTLKAQQQKLGRRVPFDYVKLSHHASKSNFSQELLNVIDCNHFIISADAYNQHFLPDKETLAKILCHPIRDKSIPIKFSFNHSNPLLRDIFRVDKKTAKKYNFTCLYPKSRQRYLDIPL